MTAIFATLFFTASTIAAYLWLCVQVLRYDNAKLRQQLDAANKRLNEQEAQRQPRQVEWVVGQ